MPCLRQPRGLGGARKPDYGVPCPMKARIFVTLKGGVLDPQGKAIHYALEGLGFGGVNDVRAGKLIELDLADGTSDEDIDAMRSEEHTSELQSLMRISYAVFCLKKKKKH